MFHDRFEYLCTKTGLAQISQFASREKGKENRDTDVTWGEWGNESHRCMTNLALY